MKIPVGLQLHIHSWENDGDASGVEILNGLTKEDVKFYVELLQLFDSGGASNGRGFGNGIDTDMTKVGMAILGVFLEHPDISEKTKKRFEWLKEAKPDSADSDELSDGIREVMGDLLGYPSTYEYDFRVFDYFEVYEIKTPINDVTSKFKKSKKAK